MTQPVYLGSSVANAFYEAMRRFGSQRDSDPARLATHDLVETVFASHGLQIVAELAPAPQSEPLRAALERLDSAVADFLSEYDPDGPDDPDGASGVYDVELWEAHEAARAALRASPQPESPPLSFAAIDQAARRVGSESRAVELLRAIVTSADRNGAIDRVEEPIEQARAFLREQAVPASGEGDE